MIVADYVYEHRRGRILARFSHAGLCSVDLPAGKRRERVKILHSAANDRRVWELHHAFERYFAGLREDFGPIPLDLSEGTPFQQAVWQAARSVPWGAVSTYGELAGLIGKPKAARAVGQALGANPVSLAVPCHRFIAADGGLGGFGSGLGWKRDLLELEGAWKG